MRYCLRVPGHTTMAISFRMKAADAAFAAVKQFYSASRYSERRFDPGVSDFTFGNPHEMPLPGLVTAIRERALPHDKNWFAYKTSEEKASGFLAEHLGRELGLTFDSADIALTSGAFAAIMVAFHLVLDPGDEAIFSEPAWFCYEPLLIAAAAVARKVVSQAACIRSRSGRDRRGHRSEDPSRHRQYAAQSHRTHL